MGVFFKIFNAFLEYMNIKDCGYNLNKMKVTYGLKVRSSPQRKVLGAVDVHDSLLQSKILQLHRQVPKSTRLFLIISMLTLVEHSEVRTYMFLQVKMLYHLTFLIELMLSYA